MTRILLLITDDGKVINVDIDYSPPPSPESTTPAERLTARVIEFLQSELGGVVDDG